MKLFHSKDTKYAFFPILLIGFALGLFFFFYDEDPTDAFITWGIAFVVCGLIKLFDYRSRNEGVPRNKQ